MTSTIADHSHKDAIERDMQAGVSVRQIAARYKVGRMAVQRHKAHLRNTSGERAEATITVAQAEESTDVMAEIAKPGTFVVQEEIRQPKDVVIPVAATDHGTALTTSERSRFAELERIVEQGRETFVRVGLALAEIKQRRLYRTTHASFESYLDERWEMSRARGYQLIEAATVTQELSTFVDSIPANEAQARALATVPAEQRQEVWETAVKSAPQGKVTATHIRQVADEKRGKPMAGVTRVEVDEVGADAKKKKLRPSRYDADTAAAHIREAFTELLRHCPDAETMSVPSKLLDALDELYNTQMDTLGNS